MTLSEKESKIELITSSLTSYSATFDSIAANGPLGFEPGVARWKQAHVFRGGSLGREKLDIRGKDGRLSTHNVMDGLRGNQLRATV